MNIQPIPLSDLEASAQPRPLVTADVDRLAASIREVGLIQPIVVQRHVIMRGLPQQGYRIVAGHHRVAACRALGHKEITAIVVNAETDLEHELVEIDENLCRSELTSSQRTAYTKRRRQIWEALHPVKRPEKLEVAQAAPPQVSSHGGARPQTKSFAASTAAATGMTKQAINRHLARAEALGDETLSKITGTSLDAGVEMDALAKLPQTKREELVQRASAGERVSARTAPTRRKIAAEEFASAVKRALRGVLEHHGMLSITELAGVLDTTNTDAMDEISELLDDWQRAIKIAVAQ